MPEVATQRIEARRAEVETLAERLSEFAAKFAVINDHPPCAQPLPTRDALISLVEDLRRVLFPGYFGDLAPAATNVREVTVATLETVAPVLEEQIRRAFCFGCTGPEAFASCNARAADMTQRFLDGLPQIQALLIEDIMAAYEGDPACTSPNEAILAYPGLYALTCFRLAHALSDLEVPLLPRMITEFAHSATGIDIHPGAKIGKRFFIDHGTGVVIGETCVIGNRVRLYQGVTLGAKSFPLDDQGRPIKGVPRHPIIEDDVIIYAGATILGRITIGRESVIGGNVWLTRGVPPGSRVTQGSANYEAFHFGSGI